jgi:abequosyltransferase
VTPTLSICIPTHHGRARVLGELLETIAAQTRPGLEVCVSDNASQDPTSDVVAAFRESHGIATVYRRSRTNLGVARNIVAAVEIASGDYCWLVGSDDHLAAGAIDTVAGLLARHPDASGLTTRRDNFAPDMSARVGSDRDGFYPDVARTTVFRGADEVIANLGQAFAFLGVNVVHRGRFLRAARDGVAGTIAHPLWPQIYLFGLMARRDPVWIWHPTPLIAARSNRSYIDETKEAGADLATVHARMITTLGDVWADLVPRGGPVHRALVRRSFGILAGADQIAIIKRRADHSLRGDLAMLGAFTRCFWWLPEFWRESFRALLVPAALAGLADRLRSRALPASEPLAPGAACVRIDAAIPPVVPIRSTIQLPVSVRNAGRVPLASSRPNPVHVSYVWSAAGHEPDLHGLRGELPGVLEPGASADLTLRVLTPWEPGDYTLRLTAVQEWVAWFSDLDARNALDGEVRAVVHDDM